MLLEKARRHRNVVHVRDVVEAVIEKNDTPGCHAFGLGALSCADPGDCREVRVGCAEFLVAELLRREAVQERGVREDVPVHVERCLGRFERDADQPPRARGRDSPQVAVLPVLQAGAACRRERGEQDAPGLQEPVAFAEDGLHVVDDMDRLGQDDAVEAC